MEGQGVEIRRAVAGDHAAMHSVWHEGLVDETCQDAAPSPETPQLRRGCVGSDLAGEGTTTRASPDAHGACPHTVHPSAAAAFVKRLETYGDMGDEWAEFWLGWSHRAFFVAVERLAEGEVVVGCVGVKEGDSLEAHDPAERARASLWRMSVVGTRRHHGIGRRLVMAAEAFARSVGYRQLWLSTVSGTAVAFFQALSFVSRRGGKHHRCRRRGRRQLSKDLDTKARPALDQLAPPAERDGWSGLPVAAFGRLAALLPTSGALPTWRLVCKAWRAGVDRSVLHLTPRRLAVEYIVQRFPAVASLDLRRGGAEVRDCHLGQLARSGTLASRLCALDVSGCPRVTATGIEAVAKACVRCVVVQHPSEHRRIPCPLDPTHTVLEAELDRHLANCPSHLQQLAAEACSYYHKGANAGSDDEQEGESKALDFDGGLLAARRRALALAMPLEEFHACVHKVWAALDVVCPNEVPQGSLVDAMPTECIEWMEKAEAESKMNGHMGIPFSSKHCMQQAAIAGQMKRVGLLPPTRAHAYVEMGAGRGYLSSMIAESWGKNTDIHMVLVERNACRFKAERSMKKLEKCMVERYRIDLVNLAIQRADSLQSKRVVITGKHVCGCATDYALRACIACRWDRSKTETQTAQSIDTDILVKTVPSIEGEANNLRAKKEMRFIFSCVAIATCCHHMCTWRSYLNKKFFRRLGFTPAEFDLIAWMTGWALCGDHSQQSEKETNSDDEPNTGPAPNGVPFKGDGEVEGHNVKHLADACFEIGMSIHHGDRRALGQACKRLIDSGRQQWLQEKGMKAELVRYIDASISPENRLLLAHSI